MNKNQLTATTAEQEQALKACILQVQQLRSSIVTIYPKSDNKDYPNTSLEDDTAYELIGSLGTIFDSLGTLMVELVRKEVANA